MAQSTVERLNSLTGAEIAALVQKHIDTERQGDPYFEGIPFEVDGEHIIRTSDHVRVPVRALRKPYRTGYLHGFLADVNVHLIDEEGLNILLSPEEPQDEVEIPAHV